MEAAVDIWIENNIRYDKLLPCKARSTTTSKTEDEDNRVFFGKFRIHGATFEPVRKHLFHWLKTSVLTLYTHATETLG